LREAAVVSAVKRFILRLSKIDVRLKL